MKQNQNNSLFDRTLLRRSLRASFTKLDPRQMVKNPMMFTVEVVTFAMLLLLVWIAVTGNTSQGSLLYNTVVFFVLLLTVLFANFAEAIAEARGKAQADSLRKTREETPAKRIEPDGQSHIVSSSALKQATSSNVSRATPSPPTARSSRASPRSTRAPSRANPPR